MELTVGLTLGALPVVLLGVSVVISNAHNKLHKRNLLAEQDKQSLMEILEGSNDVLFVINFVNGRIHQANERAASMLGYTREELSKLTIFQLHPDEYMERSAMRIAEAWESKGGLYEDIPLLTSTGELIDVESSVRVTTYNGKPAVILFARDIRDRLALQRRVNEQQAVVGRQNRDLLSSIRYAQRIQRAVLPEAERLRDILPDSFILFRPRDIVSGDLYWFAEVDGRVVLAAADCTGHGVPGALLSLIGASLFQESVIERRLPGTALVLDALRGGFAQTLNRSDASDQRDGMNVGLVSFDRASMVLLYSGAYGPLYVLHDGTLTEHKGDRMPIGQHEGEMKPFAEERIQLRSGDRFYLFSDGLCDQFGGPLGRKLRSAGLKQWLVDTAGLTMDEQEQAISDKFRLWKGKEEQVDDVLLIGVQV